MHGDVWSPSKPNGVRPTKALTLYIEQGRFMPYSLAGFGDKEPKVYSYCHFDYLFENSTITFCIESEMNFFRGHSVAFNLLEPEFYI